MSTAVVGMRLSLDYPSRSCTSWRPNVTSPALPSSCRAPSGMKCQTWTTSWTCGGSVDHNTGYRSPTTKCLSNSIRVDMIFLRPITSQVKGNAANIFLNSFNPESDPVPIKVQRGMPVAQLYANDKHKDFNRSHGEGGSMWCPTAT